MRFDVEGQWHNGDALKLAYMVKAAASRFRQDNVLIDLRGVVTAPDSEGKFLICDRLRRALTPKIKVGVVATPDLVDQANLQTEASQCPAIALFGVESEAVSWLRSKTSPKW